LEDLVPAEVVETSLGRKLQTLLRASAQGSFPPPVKLRSRYYWFQEDLSAWVELQRQSCIKAKQAKPALNLEVDTDLKPGDAPLTAIKPDGGAN
jgi:predicted DNA-binding transcriptional regulator AlpA